MSKYTLAASSVKYLGHLVNEHGVRPNQNKVVAISNFPVPRDVKSLKVFLGMVGFHCRYIPGYSYIAEPFTPLLQLTRGNTSSVWSPQCQEAFENSKHRLVNVPILAFPDWTKPFTLTCDALGYATGYVLRQMMDGVERPVANGGRA